MDDPLAGIKILEHLTPEERAKIAAHCRRVSFKKGAQILADADTGTDVFFVLAGAVNVINHARSGREISFATVRAGNHFGELAAIDGLPRTASIAAAEDCELAVLPARAFKDLLRADNEVSNQVIQRLVRIVRDADERIMDLSTLGAFQRVYAELLRRAEPDGVTPGLFIIRPFPPEREIASRASTTRESVARALRQLRESGIIKRKGRNLYIMDRKKLEEIVSAYDVTPRG